MKSRERGTGNGERVERVCLLTLLLLLPLSLSAQTTLPQTQPQSLATSQPASAPISQPIPASAPSKPEIAPVMLPFVPIVDAAVDADQTTLGGIIRYTLTIKRAKEVSVVVPDPLFFGPELRVRSTSPTKLEETSNEVTETRVYELQIFGLEEVQIPAFTFDFRAPPGIAQVASPSITLTVPKTLPPEEDINDKFTPREIAPAEAAWLTWLKAYGPYLLLLLLVTGIGYVLRKKKKKPIEEEVLPPKEDPTVVALRRLASLEAQKPHAKEFHLTLSEVLRGYLEDALQVENAREATNTELLARLKELTEFTEHRAGSASAPEPGADERASTRSRLAKIETKKLASFLSEDDLVKFAKHVPPLPELLQSLEFVRDTVEKTKPQRRANEVR